MYHNLRFSFTYQHFSLDFTTVHYEDITENDRRVKFLWKALENFTNGKIRLLADGFFLWGSLIRVSQVWVFSVFSHLLLGWSVSPQPHWTVERKIDWQQSSKIIAFLLLLNVRHFVAASLMLFLCLFAQMIEADFFVSWLDGEDFQLHCIFVQEEGETELIIEKCVTAKLISLCTT